MTDKLRSRIRSLNVVAYPEDFAALERFIRECHAETSATITSVWTSTSRLQRHIDETRSCRGTTVSAIFVEKTLITGCVSWFENDCRVVDFSMCSVFWVVINTPTHQSLGWTLHTSCRAIGKFLSNTWQQWQQRQRSQGTDEFHKTPQPLDSIEISH